MNLQRFAVVAFALADFARHVHIGQKVHFNFDNAVAGTILAAPAPDIKAKATGAVAANFGLRRTGKQLTDRGEQTGVRSRVGAGRAANRRLVDDNGFVQLFDAFDVIVFARNGVGTHEAR